MGTQLVGTYDLTLVALSYAVAATASFVALDLTGRLAVAQAVARAAWLTAGSLTMGLGIWGMHFVGMLAFDLPVQMRYDVAVVALSTVPAVVASALALFIASRSTLRLSSLLGGSVAMGAAIAGMHYVGMAAMRSSAALSYRPGLVVTSIAIAVLASMAALWLAFNLRDDDSPRGVLLRGVAALVMGVAVVGMHYTGMAAAVFTATDAPAPTEGAVAGTDLVMGVAGAALLAAAVALLASFADRQSSRGRMFQMTMTMTAVAAGIATVSIGGAYRTAVTQETRRLSEFAARQATLIRRAVGQADGLSLTTPALFARLGATATELAGSGETRLLIGREVDGSIVFIGSDLPTIPLETAPGAESMRRAVTGASGTMRHSDQRGVPVLAAYAPVGALDIGVVATIDVVRLRLPFVRSGLLTGVVALGLVLLGSLLFARIGNPMIARIEEGDFLDSVLSSFPHPLLIAGPDERIHRVNPAFEKLFGKPRNRVGGMTLEECLGRGNATEDVRELASLARRVGSAFGSSELTPRGRPPVPLRLSAAAVGALDEGSVVLVAEDVTEIRNAQTAMEAAVTSANEASRAKSAFLANMSHEIRTPMNGIMGMLELLLDTKLDSEQRESATTALGSAEGLLTILNDLLDFSKIEAGHVELENIAFELHRLVSDTARVMTLTAVRRRNELVVDIAEEVPAFVMGDPGRVRQILTNLVGNAIKFTEGGEVVVTVRPAGAAGGSVEFSIKDTGIGIPTEKLEAIFEEFSQADVSVTRMHGGTGLGLSISRRLVQLMGGTLTVESEIGRGSTFCFVVPLQPGAPHQGFAADRRTVSLEGARILVVDDNETASLIARKTLESVGAIVDEAPSADQGLQLLVDATEQGRPYDAAIIDSMMPVKDGFELASDVEAEPSITGTRLLMLTSAGERAGRRKAEEYGIRGYLNKPVPRSDLIRAVGQVLGLRGPGDGTERRIITEDSLAADRPPASVLLVEDNAVNRLIARKMLEKWGHVVDMAVDGQEAVTKASDGKYDVILMDLQMPVMDGFEATRAILAMERNARVPIIAVTAHALSEERERCEEVGMTGFVTKPYKANELCAAVDGVLRTFSRASIAPGMGEVG